MNFAAAECRRGARVCPAGAEVLLDDPQAPVMMRVHDLARDGVYVVGATVPEVGARLRMVLLLPNRPPLMVEGRVVRRSPPSAQPGFAALIEHVTPDSRRLLHEAVFAEVSGALRAHGAHVLVIEGAPHVGRPLCAGLKSCGAEVSLASTAVGAINWLLANRRRVTAAIIGTPYGSANARELVTLLRDELPDLWQVILVKRGRRGVVPRGPDTSLGVAVLEPPWSPSRLASLLLAAHQRPAGSALEQRQQFLRPVEHRGRAVVA